MRFLIVFGRMSSTEDMAPGLPEGLLTWVQGWQARGRLDGTSAFAGSPGGVIIANVASEEELSEMLSTFPADAAFSISAHPIADLEPAPDAVVQAIQALGSS